MRYYVVNIYSTKTEADAAVKTAHEKWETLGYKKQYKDSAQVRNLGIWCNEPILSEKKEFYICSQ